ncbi:hypothetical protein GJ496_000262 [Pomphorhynchus laevis]|nr:hypothetical protein GJ496_000262 [Pomphorhynchus laevis]
MVFLRGPMVANKSVIYRPWKHEGVSILRYAWKTIPHMVVGTIASIISVSYYIYRISDPVIYNPHAANIFKKRYTVYREDDMDPELKIYCN